MTVSRIRRRLLQGGAAASTLGVLGFPSISRGQAETIRLGHLTPRTGFLGPLGEYAVMAKAGRLESVPPQRRTWVALLAALALIAVWQPVRAYFNAGEGLERVNLAPIAGANGWTSIPEELSPWRPDVTGARVELRQTFQKAGARVGVHIAFFRDQTKYAKAVASTNQLVRPTNNFWRQIQAGSVATEIGGAPARVRLAVVSGNGERLAAWQWYGSIPGSLRATM